MSTRVCKFAIAKIFFSLTDFSIYSSRSNQGRVERLDLCSRYSPLVVTAINHYHETLNTDLVRGHDDLDITSIVESIQLVQELEHCSLNLPFTSGSRVVSAQAITLTTSASR